MKNLKRETPAPEQISVRGKERERESKSFFLKNKSPFLSRRKRELKGARGIDSPLIKGVGGILNNQILKITLTSLIAALACTGIIYAATTVGTNISTGGTLDVTGASTFTTASSTGIVKFAQINSDTGAISFGNENLTTTGKAGIGTTSLGAVLNIQRAATGNIFNISSSTAGDLLAIDNNGYASVRNITGLGFTYKGNQVIVSSPYESKQNSYKGQLHTHADDNTPPYDCYDTTTSSQTAYKNAGYDFAVANDHNIFNSDPGVAGILFIPAVEQTASAGGANVGHIQALNVTQATASTDSQTIIDDIAADGGISMLNHPNAVTTAVGWSDEEIESLRGITLMDIYDEIVRAQVSAEGYAEGKWDTYLSKYKKVWGVAVDDFHKPVGGETTLFNKGWVVVFADSLTLDNIITSLKNGNFYSSTGPTLDIKLNGRTITATTDSASSIEWIKKDGATAQTTSTNVSSATYNIIGDETYVRIKVTRDSDSREAWSQPIYIDTVGDLSEKYLALVGSSTIPYKLNINVGGASTTANALTVTNTGTGNSFIVNDELSELSPFVIDSSGDVGIGTISPSAKLTVVGDGTNPAFSVSTTTAHSSTILYIDSANSRVGIGNNAPTVDLEITGSGSLLVQPNTGPASIKSYGIGSDGWQYGYFITGSKPADATAVIDTTILGVYRSDGWDGNSWDPGGQFKFTVAEDWGNGSNHGTKFEISTVLIGATPSLPRFEIDGSGNIALPNDNQELQFGAKGSGGDGAIIYNYTGNKLGFDLTSGYSTNFFISTENEANIFYIHGDNSRVGIGTSSPGVKLDVNGIIKTQPASSRTCNALAEGGIYYDSDDSHFYGCNGSTWLQLDN